MAGHPLDPLTASEIELAASLIRKHAVSMGIRNLRFNSITLKEPKKCALIAYNPNLPSTLPPRQVFLILQDPPNEGAIEVVLTLSQEGKIESWERKDGQPLASPDDCLEAEAIVKADPEIIKLLNDVYDVTDLTMVVCDPWSVHLPPFGGRLIQTFMYMHNGNINDNAYAHPIDFVPIVDLNMKKVVHVDKPHGSTPPKIPSLNVNYHRDLVRLERPLRNGLKPLNILQPEGGSWTVDGNLVSWQNWRIRVGFNYREGLVLHDVKYQDGDRLRPILHRLSLVEMAVPYADPHAPFTRKCAFDVGDYGLGNCTSSLELGCDCLGEIFYFDAVLNNSKGEPVKINKAICMHEEDNGIAWKHVEYRNGHSEVRRSRCLVLSFVATVVNYEYAFYVKFFLDGTIDYEIKLTGELSTNALSADESNCSRYGTMVCPGVNAQFHQHLFCARIDLAIDDNQGGKDLLVSEVDVLPSHGPENVEGNVFIVKETPLLKEKEAQRIADPSKARYWKISNPSSIHPYTKKPVAWKLVAPPGPLLLATPGSALTKRGAFATKTLWVTPHGDDEKWPAGDYTMQSEGGDGLPKWTAGNRDCGPGCDPVVWLTFGTTHVPRVEDFPCMPVEVVSFHLKPFCFFEANPCTDLPADPNAASCCRQ